MAELHDTQEIIRKSLIHRCCGEGMQIIENKIPENNSRFYVCKECNSREIPYLARVLGYDSRNFYLGN